MIGDGDALWACCTQNMVPPAPIAAATIATASKEMPLSRSGVGSGPRSGTIADRSPISPSALAARGAARGFGARAGRDISASILRIAEVQPGLLGGDRVRRRRRTPGQQLRHQHLPRALIDAAAPLRVLRFRRAHGAR